jgi:spore coat polysaccharide biosynthesis protein SpsF
MDQRQSFYGSIDKQIQKPNIAIIIQARMGSTRLPGKVLKQIQGKSVLRHVIERVSFSNFNPNIVIATTENIIDDPIMLEAERMEVQVYRGSENDVLLRYYEAAQFYRADIIVRITSDCPLIDYTVLDQMLARFIIDQEKLDYLSNTCDRTFPRGLDIEIFKFESLQKAYNEAKMEFEREHVTPYIWRHKELFRIKQFKNDINYANLRWTLDTTEDFELIKEIYDALYGGNNRFGMKEILIAYKNHPEWNLINASVEQKLIF